MPDAPDPYRLAQQLYAALATHQPDVAAVIAQSILPRLTPRRHGPDYTCIAWDGTIYSLTLTQARVVHVLWDAMEAGVPEVHQDTLLEASGSESRRLASVFKDAPAWNKLIVPGAARGTYRLPPIS